MDCPLGVPHPRAGPDYKTSSFPLGCSLCERKKVNEVVVVTAEMRKKYEENLIFRVEEPKRLEEENKKRMEADRERHRRWMEENRQRRVVDM